MCVKCVLGVPVAQLMLADRSLCMALIESSSALSSSHRASFSEWCLCSIHGQLCLVCCCHAMFSEQFLWCAHDATKHRTLSFWPSSDTARCSLQQFELREAHAWPSEVAPARPIEYDQVLACYDLWETFFHKWSHMPLIALNAFHTNNTYASDVGRYICFRVLNTLGRPTPTGNFEGGQNLNSYFVVLYVWW